MRLLLAVLTILSCCLVRPPSRQKVNLLIQNAVVYTADSHFTVARSFAIKDGKFLAISTKKFLQEE